VPLHILTSVREARATGRPHALLTLAVAAWLRHLRGFDDRGRPVEIDDPMGRRLQALAREGGTDPAPLLDDRATFGDLGEDFGFVSDLRADLRELEAHGARAVTAARSRRDERRAAA
jgi:fructuronate reductase/mannitol 2-dehydrogenase